MKPTSSHLEGKTLEGVGFGVSNRDVFSASRFGLALAQSLAALYPGKIKFDANLKLIGSAATIDALNRRADPQEASGLGLEDFLKIREKFLSYR
jgi:hypothetical protein